VVLIARKVLEKQIRFDVVTTSISAAGCAATATAAIDVFVVVTRSCYQLRLLSSRTQQDFDVTTGLVVVCVAVRLAAHNLVPFLPGSTSAHRQQTHARNSSSATELAY